MRSFSANFTISTEGLSKLILVKFFFLKNLIF